MRACVRVCVGEGVVARQISSPDLEHCRTIVTINHMKPTSFICLFVRLFLSSTSSRITSLNWIVQTAYRHNFPSSFKIKDKQARYRVTMEIEVRLYMKVEKKYYIEKEKVIL